MTPDEYQQLALRTEKGLRDKELQLDVGTSRLMHAAVGLCTETGELQDTLKKKLFYDRGRELDLVNIMEELGDILWYVAIGLDAIGSTMGEAMEKNIAKLKARYPDGFTSVDALHRDTDKEREILEGPAPVPYMRVTITVEGKSQTIRLREAQLEMNQPYHREFELGKEKAFVKDGPALFSLTGKVIPQP